MSSIGRPDRAGALAARLESDARRARIGRRPPELALMNPSDAAVARRHGGRIAFADLARRAAREAHQPDILLGTLRIERGVRILAGAVRALEARVDDRDRSEEHTAELQSLRHLV